MLDNHDSVSEAVSHNGFPTHSTGCGEPSKPNGAGYVSPALVLTVPLYNQPFMDTATYLTRLVLILVLPLLMLALPLLALLKLTGLKAVRASAFLLFLSTLSSALIGCLSTYFAFVTSSYGMGVGVARKGVCVTGALLWVLVGGLFTLMTLVVGVSQSIYRATR